MRSGCESDVRMYGCIGSGGGEGKLGPDLGGFEGGAVGDGDGGSGLIREDGQKEVEANDFGHLGVWTISAYLNPLNTDIDKCNY